MGKAGPDPLDRLADLVRELRARDQDSDASREALIARHESASMGAPPPAEPALAGRRLGPFDLRREVGRGGMGVVYEAWDGELGRAVALKVLPAHLTLRPRMVERFRREASAVARLRHPNIVTIHRVDHEGSTHFFAMELVEGAPLDRVLLNLRVDGRSAASFHAAIGASAPPASLSYLDLAVDLVASIAEALEHAHQEGVVHRDVKPSNILVRRDGSPVLTDFGLSLLDDESDLTRSGEMAGTPSYLSPEQAVGARGTVDARSDVFSLGVTLYEVLTLEKPFTGHSSQQVVQKIVLQEPRDPQRIATDVPADLAAIVLKALEKDKERRYQSAGEMALDLRAFRNHLPVSARKATVGRRVLRFARRKPLAAALCAVLALGVPALSGLAGFVWAKRGAIAIGEQELAFTKKETALVESLLGKVTERGSTGPSGADLLAEALRESPDDDELLSAQGWITTQSRNAEQGLAWIAQLGDRRKLRCIRWLEAAFLRAKRDVERASAVEEELGEPATSFEWFLRGLSAAYLPPISKERCAEAIGYFERAILESHRPRRVFYYAICQFGLMARQASDVAPFAAAATRLWPEDPRVWAYATWVHGEIDPESGEKILRAGLALHPKNAELNVSLGEMLYDKGEGDAAEKQLRVVLAIDPAESQTNLRLCRLLLKRRDAEKLRAAIAEWIRNAPVDVRSSQVLASYLSDEGLPRSVRDVAAATKAAEDAVRLSEGTDAPALWTLAGLRAGEARYDEALALAEKATKVTEHFPTDPARLASQQAFLARMRSAASQGSSRPSTSAGVR